MGGPRGPMGGHMGGPPRMGGPPPPGMWRHPSNTGSNSGESNNSIGPQPPAIGPMRPPLFPAAASQVFHLLICIYIW